MSDDEYEYRERLEEPDEGEESVGEDAELELSCALQDLAQRVKTFEENMKGRFRSAGSADDDGDDEIDEDIPEADAPAPKQPHRRRKDGVKAAGSKQQADEEDDEDPYGDEEFSDDDCAGEADAKDGGDDWDYQEQTEELSELKHNIALLLQGFKEEAKALECADDGGYDNQAK